MVPEKRGPEIEPPDSYFVMAIQLKRMSGLSWNFGGGPHGLMVKR
jgi:hypothetical protein